MRKCQTPLITVINMAKDVWKVQPLVYVRTKKGSSKKKIERIEVYTKEGLKADGRRLKGHSKFKKVIKGDSAKINRLLNKYY